MHKRHKVIITILISVIAAMPSSFAQSINKDTRKGFDLRNAKSDSSFKFVAKYHPQLPVIIVVATDDDRFVTEMKRIIKEMDIEGYEEISLVVRNLDSTLKSNGVTHHVLFIKNGDIVAGISHTKRWVFILGKEREKMYGIDISTDSSGYPTTIIRTKIRSTHEGSGAKNHVVQK